MILYIQVLVLEKITHRHSLVKYITVTINFAFVCGDKYTSLIIVLASLLLTKDASMFFCNLNAQMLKNGVIMSSELTLSS